MKKLVLTFATLLMVSVLSIASSDVTAENESVRTMSLAGQVFDVSTGEALAGVKVALEGTNEVSYSDFEGNFSFKGLVPGSYKLSTSYISYKSSDVEVKVYDEVNVKVAMEQLTR